MKWRTVQTLNTPGLTEAKATLKQARQPIVAALSEWRAQAEKLTDAPGPASEYRAHTDKDGAVSIQFREVPRE